MKPPRRACLSHPRTASRRGSGIAMAIIFSSVLALVLASMLRWMMNEAGMNQRAFARLEARNAAEAVAEYGFTQVRYRMENSAALLSNAFGSSGAYPLTVPPSSIFAGTNVSTAAIELKGGAIANVVSSGSTTLYYIDANDPNNFNDPLKGKWIFRRDVPVYAKAVVTVPNGPSITAYVREKISVRGAPLFAHAIFYNMDMELAPGATMNIYGPVHANGDIYVSSQGASVNFYNTVTTTGNIYHAWKSFTLSAQGQTNSSMTSGEALNMTSDVTFKNRLGAQVSMDATGTWKDSTMGYSTTVKTNNTSGSYATQAAYTAALANAATSNVNAFKTFISTTWNGNVQTSANGVQNYTPVAIGRYSEDTTPSDSTDQSVNTGRLLIEPPTASTSPQYSAEVEAQKYSTQAGIYIQVVPASGATSTTTTSGSTTTVTSNDPTVPAVITVRTGGPNGPIAATYPSTLARYYPYKQTAVTSSGSTTYTVNSGMYDQRRGSGQDIVEIDMNALKDAVTQMQLAAGSRDVTKAISSLDTSQWTGIVYVNVTSNPTTNLDGSTVVAASGSKVGVRLINGNQQVPTYGTTTEGLTIATNAPVYIKGHFNDTGTSPSASVPKTGETPAAIAADAVTLLSSGFNDATSRQTVRPDATADSVIAAAILTGITPTNKDASARMSGGAHNLVRFLENWTTGSHSVYIRGSLVALFESRIATQPWKIDYYSAPTRNWGFNQLFQNGRYPPGTPRVISYRRTDYTDLTQAEYAAATAGL